VVGSDLLVLVKHARPDVDPNLPAAEWTLGVDGMEAAIRLGERLRSLAIDLVVSSVEPTAVETARLAAQVLGIPSQSGHDLHEHLRTSTGYLDRSMFEASIRRFFAEPSALVFGDETADVAGLRFGNAVDALHKVHRGRRLCVVAHGTVISLHLERRYGVDGWTTWQRLDVPSYVVVDRKSKTIVDLVSSV
jgi:broad specificity phosphatase PhoE